MSINILFITYNQESYIRQAIDGVLMQHLDSDVQVRIIVADDCSTDDTLPIIRDCLGGSKTTFEGGQVAEVVYLTSNTNLGHVRNYQRAFAACKGDFVAIIEGDDYWNNANHLQTRIDFMTDHPECVLTTQCPVWYYEEEKRFDMREKIYVDEPGYKAIPLEEEIYDNQITNLSSCVIRGHAIRKLNEQIFSCSILDWPLYIDLYRFGLLYVLSGTSNVYRASNKGLYSGLGDDDQRQARLKYLTEMATIFPQYESYFNEAKDKLQPKKKVKSRLRIVVEVLLTPFVACHQIGRAHV